MPCDTSAGRVSVVCSYCFISPVSSDAKDQWISVRSENFFLVGNDSEKDIRQVALKFEQFREAFSRILPKMKLNSSVPTRVLVFKNDNSFKPFKPLYQGKPALLAGFYQKGADVNHICLTSEYSEERPFAAIFHEYVHQLTGDNVRALPVWFNEGIAEYYSTFEATDKDRQISVGKPISSHVYLLRESRFLPLNTLFSVGHDSPEYNERQKKGLFYAESWALVHYLMTGDNGKHLPELFEPPRHRGISGGKLHQGIPDRLRQVGARSEKLHPAEC